MSKMLTFVFCLALIFVLLPASGYCGYITMVIQTTVTASPEKVVVNLTVQNNGNEPAYTVYPELQLGLAETSLSPQRVIGVKDIHRWDHTFLLSESGIKLHGTYPLLITLHYHDSNMYPSSMPEVVLFDLVKAGRELPFESRIEVTEIMDTGQVSLTLKNNLGRKISGRARVFLPDELATANSLSAFELQPGQTRLVVFPVSNRAAMSGSRYKVFGIMEFDDLGSHYSVLAAEMMPVLALKEDEGARRAMITGGAVFIFLLFLLMVFLELRHREN